MIGLLTTCFESMKHVELSERGKHMMVNVPRIGQPTNPFLRVYLKLNPERQQ